MYMYMCVCVYHTVLYILYKYNIYIYIYIQYVIKSISRKRYVKMLKMIAFYFLRILYMLYIYKDKTMTIFTQSTLINYSSIKTYNYPKFQTLRIFLIGKYVNHF